jgi:hypothetical protein
LAVPELDAANAATPITTLCVLVFAYDAFPIVKVEGTDNEGNTTSLFGTTILRLDVNDPRLN